MHNYRGLPVDLDEVDNAWLRCCRGALRKELTEIIKAHGWTAVVCHAIANAYRANLDSPIVGFRVHPLDVWRDGLADWHIGLGGNVRFVEGKHILWVRSLNIGVPSIGVKRSIIPELRNEREGRGQLASLGIPVESPANVGVIIENVQARWCGVVGYASFTASIGATGGWCRTGGRCTRTWRSHCTGIPSYTSIGLSSGSRPSWTSCIRYCLSVLSLSVLSLSVLSLSVLDCGGRRRSLCGCLGMAPAPIVSALRKSKTDSAQRQKNWKIMSDGRAKHVGCWDKHTNERVTGLERV